MDGWVDDRMEVWVDDRTDALLLSRKKVLSLAASATGTSRLEEITQAYVDVRLDCTLLYSDAVQLYCILLYCTIVQHHGHLQAGGDHTGLYTGLFCHDQVSLGNFLEFCNL